MTQLRFRGKNWHLRRRAAVLVQSAIRKGALVRQPCEICGATGADGHHEDYADPLRVVWLCRFHHTLRHRGDTVDEMRAWGPPSATRKLGSASSIPAPPSQWGKSLMPCRGGDADPNTLLGVAGTTATNRTQRAEAGVAPGERDDARPGDSSKVGDALDSAYLIRDPVLRAAFLRAYRAWEKRQERTTT